MSFSPKAAVQAYLDRIRGRSLALPRVSFSVHAELTHVETTDNAGGMRFCSGSRDLVTFYDGDNVFAREVADAINEAAARREARRALQQSGPVPVLVAAE